MMHSKVVKNRLEYMGNERSITDAILLYRQKMGEHRPEMEDAIASVMGGRFGKMFFDVLLTSSPTIYAEDRAEHPAPKRRGVRTKKASRMHRKSRVNKHKI